MFLEKCVKKLACLATLSLAPFLFAQIPKLRPAEQAITDQKGVPIGIAVRVGEVNMTFTVPRLGPISAPGLPAIMPVHDDRERDQLIRTTAGAALAHLRYSKADYLESVSIGDGYQLEFTDPENGQVQETLRDANGRVLHAGAARAMVDRSSRVMGLCLDMVAADLGLASDWPKHVRFSATDSGRMTTVSDDSGKPLLYVLVHREYRVAYLPNGQALFYDIPLE